MALPEIVPTDEWLAVRRQLLAREKALTRARDELNADRRRLPMVRMEKEYVFEGPEGRVPLLDLFAGRRQLIITHFMFDPSWENGCPSCTADADEVSEGLLRHLAARDTTFVLVSRAPLAKLEAYRAKRGWSLSWYSSYGSDFNYDFHVTLDESVTPAEYNYRSTGNTHEGEQPGVSCFLRDGDVVFHTYSTFARGTDQLGGGYTYLDLTALGRQEEWEEPKGRAAVAREATPDFAE